MIVLDTNVLSELMRKAPERRVASWVDAFPASDVLVTAVTAAELMYGVARLRDGRRKRELHIKVEGVLAEDFQDQILSFDASAATHYALIVASRERTGRPISMADAQIAAICRNWSVRLATRNVDDFVDTGIDTVNPWDAAAR
ncbi:type II toxin-antitoxin system VapC family toxin [Mycobacterium sp. 663a-19]|uniref:type II toxin-antitoxin system VapC family toxin n=1 Tax=Mycobacterium sp. 663a-19 TaxID=2986148 RepID=UPI002D1E89BD|nr:type II toxin-antitoxin system VapC family toxin [Mycobacterium sp. 663a-19]MEB3981509.1 type II toxin-antitoxin system VapC family toxin [Mycobacterium sp. 663a-19]